jgi:carbon-monoxide dehydrogenase large subunit
LPHDKVRYIGQPVVAVAAEDRYLAEDAAEAIEVDYEPLPAVVDVDAAMATDAPRLFDEWPDNVVAWRDVHGGDPDQVFAAAPVVVEATFNIPRQAAAPLEGRGAVARFDRHTGQLTLWISSQAPHQYRTILASVLKMDESRIRLIVPDVGGGFGCKLHYYQDEILACVLAMRTGRPVKWIEDRREHFQSTVHAREQRVRARAAFDRDGALLALWAHIRGDVGAHAHTKGVAPIFITGLLLPGTYAVPHYHARVEAVVTNKVPFGAYRGFGMQQATFVIERLMDLGAQRLGIDPAEMRRRNLIPPERFPYRNAAGLLYDSGDYPEALARALRLADYDGLRAQQAQRRLEGRLMGVGLSFYTEITGMGPSRAMGAIGNRQGGYEPAVVRLDPSGALTVATGLIELGQGIRTSLAQIAAEILDVPVDRVHVVLGDTELTPYSSYGTADSRGSVTGGTAVRIAARLLRDKVTRLAAHLLEARPEDIELVDGHCSVRGSPHRTLTLAEVAREGYRGQRLPDGMEPGMEARFIYEPENWAYPSGVHVAAVEIDADLGTVGFMGYWVVHECGMIINPMLVEGQIHGAIAQGVGGTLLEELLYDDAGQLLSGTFMDYLLPTVADVPRAIIEHLPPPHGASAEAIKGVAEGGTIAAPAAVVNAVADALHQVRPQLAAAVTTYPLTPWRIRALLESAHE